MSSFHRILLVCAAFTITAGGCLAAPVRHIEPLRLHPAWEVQMSAGMDAADVGDVSAAARHFRRAVKLAKQERLPAEERAFASYRLGDLLRLQPDAARGEDVLSLLEESRASFERAYGPDHPVLLPVWMRLALVHDANGATESADVARAAADRIAVRFFPEHHFLRERFGAARPAEVVHPLEVLALLGDAESEKPEQIVGVPEPVR